MKKKSKQQIQAEAKNAEKIFRSLPRKSIKEKAIKPGSMVIFRYSAKDKTQIYDKTPCNIVLWRTKTHTLCIALHWAPLGLREKIIEHIYSMNKNNIKNNKSLEIEYKQMKLFLKKSGTLPIIRLYINSRMSNHGVIVPSELMKAAARYSNESFSIPKAIKLYKKAVQSYKKRKGKK